MKEWQTACNIHAKFSLPSIWTPETSHTHTHTRHTC